MVKMVETTLNGEFDITIPEHRAERPDWYTEKGWEKPRLKAMSKHIKDSDVVYYVGAEEGEMPALCQMWGAKVVLFEPNPKVWPNIKAIWDANNLDKPLLCFEGFASNDNRDVDMATYIRRFPEHAHEEVIGNHGFKELYLEGDNYPQVKIDYVAEFFAPPPTVITFDCEGSDWEVMKGAEKVLTTSKPKIFASIHPEFMFHQFGQYQREFRDWIIGFGYEETILDYQHELHTMYLPKANS